MGALSPALALGFPAGSLKGTHSFPQAGQHSPPRVLLRASHTDFPEEETSDLTLPKRGPGAPEPQGLVKCAESLEATRGRGRGHGPLLPCPEMLPN